MNTISLAADDFGIRDPSRSLLDAGKSAFERRRRLMTAVFAAATGAMTLCVRSRWSVTSVAGEGLLALGIVLCAVGSFGRLWCSVFIAGYKTKALIVCGPYSLCRNPLYFFSAVGMIGVGLCTSTLVIPLVMAVAFSAYYPFIIAAEERRLGSRHGHAFKEYCRTTPAFWPRFSRYHEPAKYTIHLTAMRRTFADAFWFIGLAVAAHLIAVWHTQGWSLDAFATW